MFYNPWPRSASKVPPHSQSHKSLRIINLSSSGVMFGAGWNSPESLAVSQSQRAAYKATGRLTKPPDRLTRNGFVSQRTAYKASRWLTRSAKDPQSQQTAYEVIGRLTRRPYAEQS